MRRITQFLVSLAIATPVFAFAHDAAAANYNVCLRYEAATQDSCNSSSCGIQSGANAGGHEDAFTTCNPRPAIPPFVPLDPGCEAIARGVRVKIWRETNNGLVSLGVKHANPTSGCVSWSDSGSSFRIRVEAYGTNANGGYVRVHNSPNDFADKFPGSTMTTTIVNATPAPNTWPTYYVGDYDRKWTAAAALLYGNYVWRNELSGTRIHAGMKTGCDGSSAHYPGNCVNGGVCESNKYITSGVHFLQIASDVSCGSISAANKFIVAHEFGHAVAALWYGAKPGAVNGSEPGGSDSHDVGAVASGVGCGMSGGYGIGTKEWNTIGFREGIAHFVSARVFNNKSTEGAFTWFQKTPWVADRIHDLERYDNGAGTTSGGQLENICGGGVADWQPASSGTIGDWMRFFWDWYTNVSQTCPSQPSGRDVLDLYAQTRLNGGLTNTNYYAKMRAAADDIGLPYCLATDRLEQYAIHNGIDN